MKAILLAVAALAAGACRPVSLPPPAHSPTPAISRVELETATPMGGWEIWVTRGELYRELAAGMPPERTDRGLWVVAYLAAKNRGAIPAALRADDFELIDRAGNRYSASVRPAALGLAEWEGFKPLGTLIAPGGELQTALVFEAPVDINLPQLLVKSSGIAIYLQ